MNVRTMYRIAQSIENILDDIIDGNVEDENEVLEVLLDAKRLTDMLSQELNNYIMRVTKG